jgi:diguanylate cyclase (GGDEF)-like protein
MAQVARGYLSEVAGVRNGIDHASTLASGLDGPVRFLDQLVATENAEIAAANREGLSTRTRMALADVDLTARATQAAASEILLYCATKFSVSYFSQPSLHASWVQTWGAFSAASQSVAERASAPIARAWQAAQADPRIAEYNSYLAADVAQPKPVDLVKLFSLVQIDTTRNHTYGTVLDVAISNAAQAGAAQHRAATVSLLWIVLATLAILLATMGGAVLLRRSVARPLERLAAQAERISRGELSDIDAAGPYEVRTVARALASSVASLRNIEAQAAAVAAGDLESPVVRQALPGPLGEVVHSSVTRIISAINDRELARHELAHQASHDALTELPNRAQAMNLVEQALHRAQRGGYKTALMFIDLDRFKAVNDNHGHAAGDDVLRTAAQRMRTAVREGDIVARLGGDEFVILLESVQDEADSVNLAERVVELIGQPSLINGRDVRIGASVGIAFCRDGYVDADRLLQEADAAAYRAKNAGRGRVEVFDDELRAQLLERSQLEAAIRSALTEDEFILYYQPVVDLMSGAIKGVEALIRWERPGQGVVSPLDFIPVAEQSTLINDIGRWVLFTACTQLAGWLADDAVDGELTMSVNISGRHIATHDFVSDVRRALAHSGVPPQRLIVEITETVLVDDPVATRNMHALRELGVQIAIDDFGTGFTSIGQLPRLPVDSLKIDRSFVASSDPAHRELVRLIVAAAHAFGLTVVAEGIELLEQADGLRALAVENGQGYLFSRPRPAESLFEVTELTAVAPV